MTVLFGSVVRTNKKTKEDIQSESLVPVRGEGLGNDGRRLRLCAIDGDDGKRIGRTEDIPLDQVLRRDH